MSTKRKKPTPEERASSMIDQVIDQRYRIIEPIGEGGMGWVYRAEHVMLRRPLAIKLLNPGYREYKGLAARFKREAFATGRLDHPNCVAVSDCGSLEDGTVYLAMELVEGESLADVLDDHPDGLGVEWSLHIARHLLAGLGHAHEAGVIHRDVKPDNVLLVEHEGDKDFVKILDFGIAKLIGEAMEEAGGAKLTESGLTMGTPYYMSPEQAFGKAIDGRSDVYAASVLLYEMLTGHLPFYDEDKLVVLAMHANDDVPLFSEIAPRLRIPTEVELLVRNGLAKNPDERIRTAETYINRIERLLSNPAITGKAGRLPPAQIVDEPSQGHRVSTSQPAQSPAADSPAAERPSAMQPAVGPADASRPSTAQPVVGPADASRPSTAQPVVGPADALRPSTAQPVVGPVDASRPSTAQPVVGPADASRPSTVQPVVDPSQVVSLGPAWNNPSSTYASARPPGFGPLWLRNWLAHWGAHWRALSRGVRWGIVGSFLFAVFLAITVGGQQAGQHGDASRAAAGGDSALDIPANDNDNEGDIAERAARILASDGAGPALELLADADIDDDPAALLVLGHARAADGQIAAAMAAYAASVKRSADSARDETLRRAMTTAFASQKTDDIDAAIALMKVIIATTDDAGAKDELVGMASRHDVLHTRSRAFATAVELGLGDRIDRLASYLLDLEQGPDCESRRQAVQKLRDLGDKRAIPALTEAPERTKSNGGNACLADDAKAAVDHLNSL